jgi:hypothetical protein
MRTTKLALCVLAMAVLAVSSVQASVITVPNHSFEDNAVIYESPQNWDFLADPVFVSWSTLRQSFYGFGAPGLDGDSWLSEATNGLGTANPAYYGQSRGQTLSTAVVPGDTYTLTVGIYNYSDSAPSSHDNDVLLTLKAGSDVIFSTNVALPGDKAAGFVDCSVSGTAGADMTGSLQVILSNYGNANVGFDNVRLTSVPEPATLALLAIGGIGALLRRRK